MTILIADLHAFLDSKKTPEDLLDARSQYYEETIKEILKALKVPINKLKFVRGRSFQLKEKYTLDFYRLANITTVAEAKKSGAEVVGDINTNSLSIDSGANIQGMVNSGKFTKKPQKESISIREAKV